MKLTFRAIPLSVSRFDEDCIAVLHKGEDITDLLSEATISEIAALHAKAVADQQGQDRADDRAVDRYYA